MTATVPILRTFPSQIRAVVIGATGGIGSALVETLLAMPKVANVEAWARSPYRSASAKVIARTVDLEDETTLAAAAGNIPHAPNLVIVATGVLQGQGIDRPERSWRDLDAATLARNFAINTVGPALVAKHLLPRLPRGERAVFAALSARVGSIADNRRGGWHGYRASKAALNQIVKTLSLELARSHPEAICVALHPGTVDTGLSKPFQANVPEGQLLTPQRSAAHLLGVIDTLTPADTGSHFAWDGNRIPF